MKMNDQTNDLEIARREADAARQERGYLDSERRSVDLPPYQKYPRWVCIKGNQTYYGNTPPEDCRCGHAGPCEWTGPFTDEMNRHVDLNWLLDYLTANVYDTGHGLLPGSPWAVDVVPLLDAIAAKLGITKEALSSLFDAARKRVHGAVTEPR